MGLKPHSFASRPCAWCKRTLGNFQLYHLLDKFRLGFKKSAARFTQLEYSHLVHIPLRGQFVQPRGTASTASRASIIRLCCNTIS